MSRNFELLQKIEAEREIREREFRRQSEASSKPLAFEPEVKQGEESGAGYGTDESAPAEINKLVQRLFLQPGSSRVVVFSAVQSGDGCSWITARAARALAARVKGSVCAVDANFRSPGLPRYFSPEDSHGLSQDSCDRQSMKSLAQRARPDGNLWVMAAAAEAPGEEERLSWLRQRAGDICREFDYVLFDAAPLTLSYEAIGLAGAVADGIAMVVRANSTTRGMAKKVTQEIEKANGRLLGVVLNRGESAIPEQVYRWLQ